MSATSAAPRPDLAARVYARLPRGARRVGVIGIGFGLLACWVPLPPVSARTPLPSIALAIVAVGAGIWAVTRGERRVGWGAIAIAILGGAAGFLAVRSNIDKLDYVFAWSALGAATLRFATPLTFAAIGGMFSERSGVVNIGLEGMMLMGAFFAAWGADRTGSWSLGLLIGMASGGALALIHALFSIHIRADQIVSGTAINFLALGITGYLYIDYYGNEGTPSNLPEIPDVRINALDDVYFIGDIFSQLNLMIWLSFALLFVSWVLMFKTPLGLRIRSVGEHPRAADTVGISVYGIRYAAVVTSGILAAAGGAYISIGFVHSFSENITAGRGFIALAALIFGMWRPFGAFAAALLFGFSTALAQRLPEYSESAATLFETLPYVLTLIAVAGVIGRSIPPAAIGRPYVKQ